MKNLGPGLSTREIAKILKMPHGTVVAIERRALAKLALAIRELGLSVTDFLDVAGNRRLH